MKEKKSVERIYPELNLEKWSIWQPANSRNQLKELMLQREITAPNGDIISAQVEVSFNSKFGPLTTEDQKVYYALIKLWQDNERSTEQVSSSTRRLARILKRRWGTKVCESITQSLYRLRFTAFVWRNSYYDSVKKETVEILDAFNILSELKIARRGVDGAVNTEVGHFRFYDLIAHNLLNGYTKPLLLESVIGFKSEIAQMLYSHLDLIMADKSHYERRTKDLFDDLQLKGEAYKNPSARKRKLEKAIRELKGVQLTTGIVTSVALGKTKDGKDHKLVVQKGPLTASRKAAKQEGKQDRQEFPPTKDQTTLQAEKLVKHFYRLFHPNAKEAHPSPKEISQAMTLIAQQDYEKAMYIVDFSHKAAPETNYKPQTFGGILQYGPKAIAEYERREKGRTAEAARRKLEEEYINACLGALSQKQYQTLYEIVKEQILIDVPSLATAGDTLDPLIRQAMVIELDRQNGKKK